MLSTAELVLAVRAGDQSAFAHLVRSYERTAIITAHSILHDYGMAQDAAQDAFMIAYSKLNQLNENAAFGPWLLKIVRNRAFRTLRECHKESPRSDLADIAIAKLSQPTDWINRYEEVITQLARLSEHERMAVVMRYLDGHSVLEIAVITSTPAETIKKRLYRALERLRHWLKKVPS